MKKIKKLSVRYSLEDYKMLVNDYKWYKKNPELVKLIYKTKIKTFSDYIRLMLEKGIND